MDGTEIRTTAIHEAGHAIIARVLGVPCGEVSIVAQDGEYLGYSVISDPRYSWERGDGPKRAAAEAFCIALYAGGEAEHVILGNGDTGDGADCERATGALAWAGVRGAQFVGDEMFDRREAALRLRARNLVTRHRRAIEALADALVDQKTIKPDHNLLNVI